MHFRIRKIIATSGFLTALECTKFDFGRRSPRLPSWFKGGATSKGRGGKGTGKEERERRERGREGQGTGGLEATG